MLKHAISPCRIRFARSDFNHVAETLSTHGERHHLAKVWRDPEGLRELLDLNEVFRSLIDAPGIIQVTPGFYFYVLVRQCFLRNGLSDPGLADYVSQLIARRCSRETSDPLQDLAGRFTRVSDFLALVNRTKGRLRGHLQVAAGNQFLLLTGLFPGHLKRRHEAGETPDLEFYVAFAQQAYRNAAHGGHPVGGLARGRILMDLAGHLPEIRQALNRLSEDLVFLGD